MMRILVALMLPRRTDGSAAGRAPEDATALALGVESAANPVGVHVGPDPNRLRAYAGMGAALVHLAAPEGTEPAPALAAEARAMGAGLVLTGRRAATGLGSGTVPYRVASELGWPIVPDVRAVTAEGPGWLLDQGLAGGRVRRLLSSGPVVATVLPRAELPINRFAAARDAVIVSRPAVIGPNAAPMLVPAGRRPMRIAAVTGDDAVTRLALLAPETAGRTRDVLRGTPETLALAFLDAVGRGYSLS